MTTKIAATFGVTPNAAVFAHEAELKNSANPAQAFADLVSAVAIIAIFRGISEEAVRDAITEAYHCAEVDSIERKDQWGL